MQSEAQPLTDLQQRENEAFGDFFNQDSSSNERESRGPNTFWLFFRTFLVLVLVIVAIYLIFRFVKKTASVKDDDSDPFLKRVAAISVATGKSVQVLTLQDHCYVVGVGDDSVTLIAELDPEKDKELITAMNVKKDSEPTKTKKNFASILATVMGTGQKKPTDSFKNSILNLKSQKHRLHNEEEISGGENSDEE